LAHHIRFPTYDLSFSGLAENDPYIQHLSINTSTPEPNLINFFRANVSADSPVIFDVGANIGVTSLLMARESSGQVFAFEPGANVFRKLVENIQANGLDERVTAVRAAVSREPGIVRFMEDSAYGHIAGDGEEVECVSIESFTKEKGIDRVDFIKIDVEGFEPEVFESLEKMAARPVAYFEYNTWCLLAYGRHNPVVFLEELLENWDLYLVASDHELKPVITQRDVIECAHDTMVKRGCVADLVAAPKGQEIVIDY
jgi:FkbM family methyltransferase